MEDWSQWLADWRNARAQEEVQLNLRPEILDQEDWTNLADLEPATTTTGDLVHV